MLGFFSFRVLALSSLVSQLPSASSCSARCPVAPARHRSPRGCTALQRTAQRGPLCKGSSKRRVGFFASCQLRSLAPLTARPIEDFLTMRVSCVCLSMRRYDFPHGVRLAALRGLGPRAAPRTQRCMRSAKGGACGPFRQDQRPYTVSIKIYRSFPI